MVFAAIPLMAVLVVLGLLDSRPAVAAESLRPPRQETGPSLDGHLTEPFWNRAAQATGFVQQRPDSGRPASTATLVKVAYTGEALYVGFICPEPEQVLHKALGRDVSLVDDDYFAMVLDPFLDRQNGVFFQVNPNGSRKDEDFRAEGNLRNPDWDGVWRAETLVTEDGWQGEIEIPWRTLRFPIQDRVSMGVNFERQRRVINEQSHWSPIARQYSIFRVSDAGTLEGLEGIRPSHNASVRPYGLWRLERGISGSPGSFDRRAWKGELEIGADAKVGLGPNFTLDLTVNTDFAEVEVDDELVNLTRYPLFFPEKREFFLEKANLFDFGSPLNRLFFTRRIGLDADGQTLPIEYGSRLTGKIGPTEIGFLDIQQQGRSKDERFDVVRVKRDLGTRSNVGLLALARTDTELEADHLAIGLDADLNPHDSLFLSLYGALTDNDQQSNQDATTWGGRARWSHPLTVLTLIHESLGADYQPVVGFAPRTAVEQTALGWEYTPEPNWPWLRRFENQGFFYWFRRRHGDLESRWIHVNPVLVGPSEQRLSVFWERDFERLFESFPLSQSLEFPAGEYEFDYFGVSLETDPSRSLTVSLESEFGDFFDGKRTTFRATSGLKAPPHLTVALTFELNHVARDEEGERQEFDTNVLRLRLGWEFNNDFGLRLFTQWNDSEDVLLSQLRAHWIFGQESDLYFVVADEREDERRNFAPRRGELVLKLGYARAF